MQKNQAEVVQQNKQHYLISGVVDFSTVPDLMKQVMAYITSGITADKSADSSPVAIDLSQVKESNSAALALMLELVKSAQQKKIELHFVNLPATVSTIAKAYGVENEIREICR